VLSGRGGDVSHANLDVRFAYIRIIFWMGSPFASKSLVLRKEE
jgi:hypothetical protein